MRLELSEMVDTPTFISNLEHELRKGPIIKQYGQIGGFPTIIGSEHDGKIIYVVVVHDATNSNFPLQGGARIFDIVGDGITGDMIDGLRRY